jgi:hypothetical protein
LKSSRVWSSPYRKAFIFSFMFVTTKILRNTITITRWVQFPKGKVGHVKKYRFYQFFTAGKSKGKGHPCTGTEVLYRPYGP